MRSLIFLLILLSSEGYASVFAMNDHGTRIINPNDGSNTFLSEMDLSSNGGALAFGDGALYAMNENQRRPLRILINFAFVKLHL